MARRAVPKEVQAIFQKYQENNVRRLKKPEALTMLQTEFGLTEEQASQMFDTFDHDYNGVMSLWEFQQFYQTVGNTAAAMVQKFEEMDKDKSGKLDVAEARQGLKEMTLDGGRHMEEREIDFFLKSSTSDDGLIDLGHFANLLFRLKVYEHKKGKK